jgi:hypothetical protein
MLEAVEMDLLIYFAQALRKLEEAVVVVGVLQQVLAEQVEVETAQPVYQQALVQQEQQTLAEVVAVQQPLAALAS